MPAGDFFDADYRRILAPFYDGAETRFEVGAIRELAGLALQDAVVDLGCGWGRHLRHLRAAGHSVVGLDLSLTLLRQAADAGAGDRGHHPPNRAEEAGVRHSAPLVCADLRRLPIATGTFDAALNLNTSLGLFVQDEPALAALAEAHRALRPGGRLLLESMHRDEAVAHYAERDRWRLEDGTEVRARRRFDPRTGVSEEVLRWRTWGGETREKRHRLRLRTGTELTSLVEQAGLEIRSLWGDWDGRPFRRLSPRLIVLADRPRG